jgi:hypothetical protein
VNVRANPVESAKSPTAVADALTAAAARLWAKEQVGIVRRFRIVKRKYRKRNRK